MVITIFCIQCMVSASVSDYLFCYNLIMLLIKEICKIFL